MRRQLQRFGHNHVYHFTDRRNLESIRVSGYLLPRSMLENEYIPGGNQWSIDADDMSGMDNYVHLCFLQKHPMEYLAREGGRIDPVWLQVSTEILDDSRVLYCAGVSNEAGAIYLTSQQALEVLDFDHMFNYHDFSVGNNMQLHNLTQKYEILVPFKIPIDLIRGI